MAKAEARTNGAGKKKALIIAGSAVLILLLGYFVPISSHDYQSNVKGFTLVFGHDEFSKIRATRYLFAMKVRVPIDHGARDRVEHTSSFNDGT